MTASIANKRADLPALPPVSRHTGHCHARCSCHQYSPRSRVSLSSTSTLSSSALSQHNLNEKPTDDDIVTPIAVVAHISAGDAEKGELRIAAPAPVAQTASHPHSNRSSLQFQRGPPARHHTTHQNRHAHRRDHSSSFSRHRSSSLDKQAELGQQWHVERKTARILVYFSGPCALLSFGLFLWCLAATMFVFLLYPFRLLCRSFRASSSSSSSLSSTPRPSLARSLAEPLEASIRVHRRCVYAPRPPQHRITSPVRTRRRNKHPEQTSTGEAGAVNKPSVLRSFCVLALSPPAATALAVAAWTVAVYWLLAAIVDPPSTATESLITDRREEGRLSNGAVRIGSLNEKGFGSGDGEGEGGGDDGRASVLFLRSWWVRWLDRAQAGEDEVAGWPAANGVV